jgi:hypothetical protein
MFWWMDNKPVSVIAAFASLRPLLVLNGQTNSADARAGRETDVAIRTEWRVMAQACRRLAEQAERNALTDTVYESPPVHITPQPQPQ